MTPQIPGFHFEAHPEISMSDLCDLEDATTIFELEGKDSDGVPYQVYTVGGRLNGQVIVAVDHINKCVHGATIEGDVIIVHGKTRAESDWLAMNGLADTIGVCQAAREAGTLEPGANAGIVVETEVRRKPS